MFRCLAIAALASTVLISLPMAVEAEEPSALLKSKGNSLVRKLRITKKLLGAQTKSRTLVRSAPLHLQLKPDTIDEILLLDQRQKKLERAYRHTSYLSLFSDFGDNDYRDESALAKHAAAYQGMHILSDYIKDSALRETYRAFTKSMKAVKQRTTVRVAENPGGDLALGDGRTDSGKQLLQFRFRNSSRHGPEARVELGESWILRHELLNSTTMFEYSLDF